MRIYRRLAVGALAAAASLSVLAAASPASAHDRDRDGRQGQKDQGTTTVVLDQSIVGALVGLGVAPVAPGTLTAPAGVYQVAFPITEVEDDEIEHSGGLRFTQAAAGDLKITRFEVDTTKGVLTAKARVDGKRIGRIPVFTLGAVQEVSPGVTPSCAGVAAGLSVTKEAAGALGVPEGLFIGDACVVPTAKSGHHDDDDDRYDD